MSTTADEGPFLSFALFSSGGVIESSDGSLEISGVYTTVVRPRETAVAPGDPGLVEFSVRMEIGLFAGKARGRRSVTLTVVAPDGRRVTMEGPPIELNADADPLRISIPPTLQGRPGLYWFEVEVGGQRLAKVPLRIVDERAPTA